MESVPLSEARKRLGDLCTDATKARQPTQITRHGKDPVVLVPQSLYEEYARLRAAEDDRRVREGLADTGPRRTFTSGAQMLRAVGLTEDETPGR